MMDSEALADLDFLTGAIFVERCEWMDEGDEVLRGGRQSCGRGESAEAKWGECCNVEAVTVRA